MTSFTAEPKINNDVQAQPDTRGIPIDQVGICDLRYPIVVLEPDGRRQETIARLGMSVSLPHHFKGTHMSRFVEVLNEHRGEITMRTMPRLLRDLKERLEAVKAKIEVEFPYFVEKTAPVSGARGLMDYTCRFIGEADGDTDDFVLGVEIPVASLCPCSKAISDYGAHSQRGAVTIRVRSSLGSDGKPQLIWIEELIDLAERSASAPVYPILKRSDERHVTMQAYDNPRFVEDILRNAALALMADTRIAWFSLHVENHESIHNHNAFATIEWSRPTTTLNSA